MGETKANGTAQPEETDENVQTEESKTQRECFNS